jgi:hypothetical protein
MIGMGAKSITIVRAVTADFFFYWRAAEVPSDEWIRDVPWGVHNDAKDLRLDTAQMSSKSDEKRGHQGYFGDASSTLRQSAVIFVSLVIIYLSSYSCSLRGLNTWKLKDTGILETNSCYEQIRLWEKNVASLFPFVKEKVNFKALDWWLSF